METIKTYKGFNKDRSAVISSTKKAKNMRQEKLKYALVDFTLANIRLIVLIIIDRQKVYITKLNKAERFQKNQMIQKLRQRKLRLEQGSVFLDW